jgi:membrane protease YdiL (CAAX protease family)
MPPEEQMEGDPELTPAVEPEEPVPVQLITAAESRRQAFWGYQDLALVIGLLLAAMVAVGVGAMGAMRVWHLTVTSPPLLLISNVAIYLALLIILKVVFSRYRAPMLPSLGWRMRSSNILILAAAGGIALPFVISGIGQLLHTPEVKTAMDQVPDSLPLGLMAVFLAPFFEELFFRGFLQPLLTRTFGIILGVLITGALFGGLHAAEYLFVWQYVVAISLVGVALGCVRVWTNSIVPTTVMHSCFNGLQIIAVAFSRHHK